jgi:site-specific DNA-methyltransferase (adenine-specific)
MVECVEIGQAKLYLGDCLEVMAGLPSGSADLIWTDPPYGNANNEGDLNAKLSARRGVASSPILNDDADSMRRVVDGMLIEACRVLRFSSAVCYCCCGGGPRPTFAWLADRMGRGGLVFFHSVIWDKVNPGLGWRYRRQHEMVMVAHRRDGKLLWADDKVSVPNIKRVPAVAGVLRKHPNEKPLGLIDTFLIAHTRPGQVVLDPFMGSGTTGVSALRLGRGFVGIELDPEHFQTACRRLEAAAAAPDLFAAAPAAAGEQAGLELF